MKDAVKMLMLACGFNVVVAIMNLWFLINNINNDNWSSAAISGTLVVINTAVSGFLYTRILQHKREEKQRVADILSGKVKEYDGHWFVDG
jgi:hypothetical protein